MLADGDGRGVILINDDAMLGLSKIGQEFAEEKYLFCGVDECAHLCFACRECYPWLTAGFPENRRSVEEYDVSFL